MAPAGAPQSASAGQVAPAAILRCTSGIYDLAFAGPTHLLSGSTTGDVSLWDLDDRRVAATWGAADTSVLSVHGLDRGRACLSQAKEGRLKLWDVQSRSLQWSATTDSCSFARALVLPAGGVHPLDAEPAACAVCSPLAEPHELGVFDIRSAGARCSLKLAESAAPQKSGLQAASVGASPLGMCMALCSVPALGDSYVLAAYESTDCCVWDLRSPQEPALPSVLAGEPGSPAICAAVLWRHIWVACADGNIYVLRVKRQGQLQREPKSVQVAPAAHMQQDGVGGDGSGWQTEKRGANVLAVRPDLRLVAAARWDRRIELFDAKTSSSLGRLQCHDGGVLCAAFERERGVFATGSEDGHIALWDTLSSTYAGPCAAAGAAGRTETLESQAQR
uniref:Peroxin-7 n=1 Tax=Alexandrium monilatum TaxID=311494 RepID=A0A7S4RZ84_9DINO